MTVDPKALVSTLPALPAIAGIPPEYTAILSALAFVEGAAAGWSHADFVTWVERELISTERIQRPRSIAEVAVGGVSITPGSNVGETELQKLLTMARSRVTVTLRAFIGSPCDDRFLNRSIFTQRVQRVTIDQVTRWVPRPLPNDFLGDIVLTLFAADILSNRSFFEQNLCVCATCGRVSFHPQMTTRFGCIEHPPHTPTQSGFQSRGQPPKGSR